MHQMRRPPRAQDYLIASGVLPHHCVELSTPGPLLLLGLDVEPTDQRRHLSCGQVILDTLHDPSLIAADLG